MRDAVAGTIPVDIVYHGSGAMPEKRPVGRPKKMEATVEKLRAVRLELPEDVHRLLRLEAAKQDVSLAALARMAVEDYLKRKGSGK